MPLLAIADMVLSPCRIAPLCCWPIRRHQRRRLAAEWTSIMARKTSNVNETTNTTAANADQIGKDQQPKTEPQTPPTMDNKTPEKTPEQMKADAEQKAKDTAALVAAEKAAAARIVEDAARHRRNMIGTLAADKDLKEIVRDSAPRMKVGEYKREIAEGKGAAEAARRDRHADRITARTTVAVIRRDCTDDISPAMSRLLDDLDLIASSGNQLPGGLWLYQLAAMVLKIRPRATIQEAAVWSAAVDYAATV